MASAKARIAAASAVKAFLAEVASVYLGKVYDPKTDALSKKWWAVAQEHFGNRCVYCNTPQENLKRNVKMTMEHLIEENQWQCGLHHPGNTVPACSDCNGSRDKAKDGSRLMWEQHLENLGRKKGYTSSTIEARRKAIQSFIDTSGYPIITPEEMRYLQATAQALYQDILTRCTSGKNGFLKIHGEAAVRVKSVTHKDARPALPPKRKAPSRPRR